MEAPQELPNPVQKRTMTAAVASASAAVIELNDITPAADASSSTTTPATYIENAGGGIVDRAGWGRGAVAGRARLEEIKQIGALYTPSPMDESQPAAGAEPPERRRSNTSDTGSATAAAPPPAIAFPRRWARMLRRSVTGHSPKEHSRPREGVFISGSLSTVSRGSSRGASTTSNRLDRIILAGKSPHHKMPEEERRSLGVFPAEFPLDRRRATELALIKKFDRPTINPHVGEFWFVIDAKWINSWVKFVMGQASAPGPISNLNLYPPDGDGDQSTSAKSLVWFIFQEIYGTDEAPGICR
ncbi:conserved unknown protein [Ectocarpus siliculosus]|uniref:DUSP domain-containing protein n=1 Tax=Ectocarpus siliculosus TaxID=2880 RepID=D7FUK4_ECTSI|nr:conserved unknown protein [Ectocarpus siliculosus]|eukprot:CBJ31660.1 conserved unknown protein [Ectocarpus siliculosus]